MPYTDQMLPFASGSETSHDAAVRIAPHFEAQELRVLACIKGCGPNGCTQVEASYLLQLGRPSVAARFRSLEIKNQILKSSARRDGCTAYQLVGAR